MNRFRLGCLPMTITWSGLMPHPPIIVPSVGRERCKQARSTISACEQLARDFIMSRPDRLILISPHSPRPDAGVGIWVDPEIGGDLSQFGAPQTKVNLPNDLNWIKLFKTHFSPTRELQNQPLDHGAMVPLYFLEHAGWSGPTCIISLPWDEDATLDHIGQAIKATSATLEKTAILASGDMSHCLKTDGPYGFHPDGPAFDQQFIAAVREGHYQHAVKINWSMRQNAKQDVLESSRIAWSACDYARKNYQFLSYEGPFGVGYSVMKFFGEAS